METILRMVCVFLRVARLNLFDYQKTENKNKNKKNRKNLYKIIIHNGSRSDTDSA
jgi:hypothetical protein